MKTAFVGEVPAARYVVCPKTGNSYLVAPTRRAENHQEAARLQTITTIPSARITSWQGWMSP
jgi:hypothetical protein